MLQSLFLLNMLSNMPTKWALYLSFLAVPAIASQYTWWVDSSCDGKFADFDGMMKETFETAQIVSGLHDYLFLDSSSLAGLRPHVSNQR